MFSMDYRKVEKLFSTVSKKELLDYSLNPIKTQRKKVLLDFSKEQQKELQGWLLSPSQESSILPQRQHRD